MQRLGPEPFVLCSSEGELCDLSCNIRSQQAAAFWFLPGIFPQRSFGCRSAVSVLYLTGHMERIKYK